MGNRVAWAAAALGLGAVAAVRLRRRPASQAPDPRAAELRRKLEESRSLVAEREEFEGAETTIDAAEPVERVQVEERRRRVHEQGRAAADEIRSRRD